MLVEPPDSPCASLSFFRYSFHCSEPFWLGRDRERWHAHLSRSALVRKPHRRDARLDGCGCCQMLTSQPALTAFTITVSESFACANEEFDVVGAPVRAVLNPELT